MEEVGTLVIGNWDIEATAIQHLFKIDHD